MVRLRSGNKFIRLQVLSKMLQKEINLRSAIIFSCNKWQKEKKHQLRI